MEDEIRAIIDRYAGDDAPGNLLNSKLIDIAQERRNREKLTSTPQTVGQLLPYLDFQDGFELTMRLDGTLPAELSAGLRDVEPAVSRAVAVRNRVAHNRPLDIDDLPLVVDLAEKLVTIRGWNWTDLNKTIGEIRQDPGFIFRTSARLVTDPDSAVTNNLPTPDFDETSLLGRKDECRQLLSKLRGSWPVISILGDGGIGKTALALQVCYELIEENECPFEVVVWVSAKNAQLTSTEIVRIESAVEDSLGLFASAAAEFGESGDPATAIDDLIEILGNFRTLLVLDNVETVLDESFPRFLQEVPVGSKVLITSRIGVKTENPFRLSGLSEDDAIKLIRILARSRNVDLARLATNDDLRDWARRMKCHPAYIKWFISGIQAGESPERLLSDNGLVLDFCMSNVFGYLSDRAKSTLRAMLIVPGAHTMAELATLARLDASGIQKVISELTTTNFVAYVRGGAGTALELSDFAREYLRRQLRIEDEERKAILERHKYLYAIGGGLKAAHALDPFDPATIDIRGVGDYSAAKLLRDAVEHGAHRQFDEGLHLCAEASELAPGYHEAARVEGYLHELSGNYWEAAEAYSRAKDLASNNQYVAFFLGKFLVASGFDPARGIRELQRAAQLDPEASRLHAAITDAYAETGDFKEAMYAAVYGINASGETGQDRADSLFKLWQNCAFRIDESQQKKMWNDIAEDAEFAWNSSKELNDSAFTLETRDLLLWVADMLRSLAGQPRVEPFIAKRMLGLEAEISARRSHVDSGSVDRLVGKIKAIKETAGYGFIRCGKNDYFFHARELWQREWFDSLKEGSVLVFSVVQNLSSEGSPKATSVHWVR